MRNSLKIVCAHGIAILGRSLHNTVFSIFIVTLLKNEISLISTVFFVKFLPYIFFGYLGGIVADSYHKKYIMLLAETFRLLTVIILAFVIFFDKVNVSVLCIIAFFMTLFRCFYQPAQQSIIVDLVTDKGELRTTNIQYRTAEEIGNIMGPAVAGFLVILNKYWLVFLVNGFIYLLSLLFIASTAYQFKKSNPTTREASLSYKKFNIIKYVGHNATLAHTIYCSALCILFISPILRFLLPLFLTDHLHLPQSMFAWLMSCVSAGTIVGAFLYYLTLVHTGAMLGILCTVIALFFILLSSYEHS